jgi:methylamine utilization protein MauE
VADVLTAPFTVAALVLCVAAVAKLRSPASAVRGLKAAGLPGREPSVRVLATSELAVGLGGLLLPGAITAVALAGVYAAFSVVALRLARRGSGCGCFGESEAPASIAQSLLSACFAAVALAAVASRPHEIGWTLARPITLLACVASAYAATLAYTAVPRAWRAWSSS